MLVRPAGLADAAALHAFAAGLALDRPPEREAHERALRDALADERSLVLVAEDGERLDDVLLAPRHVRACELA